MGCAVSTLSGCQVFETCYVKLTRKWSKTVTLIYLGIFLFAGMHLFSMLFPAVRNRLSARLGENAYKGLYSLSSLVGLVLMGIGYWQERHGEMADVFYYEPSQGARHATISLALVGFILIASNDGKGYIRKWIRHPFSIGIALWSIGHLLANGERYVVPIFVTFLALSIIDIVLGFARGGAHHFAPQIKRDIIAVVAGFVAFAIFAFGFHPYILNLPVMR
jgi:uncharacterized membrane protein